MSTGADLAPLITSLTELAIRNTASTIASRIQLWRARGANEEVFNELIELINELISERAELVSIAQAFQQELAGQRISDDEIAYIVEKLIPTIEQLTSLSDGDQGAAAENLELVKGLVSRETMTILQLVGFNFREALGAPLTHLVAQLIGAQAPKDDDHELERLRLERETAVYRIASDPEATERLHELIGN